MDLLNDSPVCILKGDEFLPKEGTTFKSQVSNYFQQQGGSANSPFGVVVLDMKGIKNDIHHGMGRLKSVSFAAIKDVLEKGVVINPMAQYHTNGKKNPTGMIAAPIQIGDEKYICVVEVIANTQIQRLYVHEVTLTKTLQKVVADTTAVHGENNPVTQPKGEIAKILQNYIITKQNSENNQENITENMNKNIVRLSESQLHRVINESVKKVLNEIYDFASGEKQYDINSDDYKSMYDSMQNKSHEFDSDLMDLQIAHHNGQKGGDKRIIDRLPHSKRQYKKRKAESLDSIISNGLRRLNHDGMSPQESFSDFKPFSSDERIYYQNSLYLSDRFTPIGTVYGETFALLYDTAKDVYVIPKQPIEL